MEYLLEASQQIGSRSAPFDPADNWQQVERWSTTALDQLTYYRGRVGLAALLRNLGVKQGDEVAIQAFTCIAVPEAIFAIGAVPRYIDIEPNRWTMDPADLKAKLNDRVRAIVVQHTFGIPTKIEQIAQVAAQHDLPLIEDCCHTFVSSRHGKTLGTFGNAAFYSFEWGKPLVAGLGGAALVRNEALARRLEAELATFSTPDAVRELKIELQYWGFKAFYRPAFYWPLRSLYHFISRTGLGEGSYHFDLQSGASSDFSLTMSRSSARRLSNSRQALVSAAHAADNTAKHYERGLETTPLCLPQLEDEDCAVFARYPLAVDDKARLLARAAEERVELAGWYGTPIHPLQKDDWHKVGYQAESCPMAERESSRIVSLPTHQRVSKQDIERSIEFLSRNA